MGFKQTGLAIPLSTARQGIKDFGTCLNFFSGGIVKLGTGNPFSDSAKGFYVSAWVRWFGLNGAYQHIVSKRDSYGATTMIFDLALKDSTGNVILDTGAGAKDFGVTLPLGRWVNVVYIHNVSPVLTEQLYIDGERVAQPDITGQGTGIGALLTIGAAEAGAIEPFNGQIDEVAIGQYCPSWLEILDICKRHTHPVTPWGYWKFDEAFGTTAIDSSGNGNTGTITTAVYSSDVFLKPRYSSTPTILLPNSLNGLVTHYKADAGVYSDAGSTPATDGDRVQQWNDQSTNAVNVSQATAGNKPQYIASAINSKPALLFSNSRQDVLTVADNAAISLTKQVHMFAVVKPITISGINGIICKDQGAMNNPEYAIWLNNGQIIVNVTTGANVNAGTAGNLAATANNAFIVEGTNGDQVGLYTYQNGAFSATANPGSSMGDSNGDLRIGAQKGVFATRSFDGYIAEIIIFSRVLTAVERKGIEVYLGNKYNISLSS